MVRLLKDCSPLLENDTILYDNPYTFVSEVRFVHFKQCLIFILSKITAMECLSTTEISLLGNIEISTYSNFISKSLR